MAATDCVRPVVCPAAGLQWMADHVDLILVFFDPIGAAWRADGVWIYLVATPTSESAVLAIGFAPATCPNNKQPGRPCHTNMYKQLCCEASPGQVRSGQVMHLL